MVGGGLLAKLRKAGLLEEGKEIHSGDDGHTAGAQERSASPSGMG